MQLLVQLANGCILVIILIGIPAITGLNVGSLRLSHTPTSQMLTLFGLSCAAAANVLAAVFLTRSRKTRRLLWAWTAAFAVIFLIEYLYFHGQIDFDWLKGLLRGWRNIC